MGEDSSREDEGAQEQDNIHAGRVLKRIRSHYRGTSRRSKQQGAGTETSTEISLPSAGETSSCSDWVEEEMEKHVMKRKN